RSNPVSLREHPRCNPGVHDRRSSTLGDLAQEQRFQLAFVAEPDIQFALGYWPAKFLLGDEERPLLPQQAAIEPQHPGVMGNTGATIAEQHFEYAEMEMRIADDADHPVESGAEVRQRPDWADRGDIAQWRR